MPAESISDPIVNGVAITPNDSTDLAVPCRGVYVGTGGNIQITLRDQAAGTNVLFKNLAAGVIHPIQAKRIYSTNTTAADIVVVY